MFKQWMKMKADSTGYAVGGIALLIGSYMLMAAVNAYLAKKQ